MEDQGKRILLFVIAAAAIFFVWQELFPPEKVQPAKAPIAGVAETAIRTPGSPFDQTEGEELAPYVGSASAGACPTVEANSADESIVLAAPEVAVTFSSNGGVIQEWLVLSDPVKGRVMNERLFFSDRPGLGLGRTNVLAGPAKSSALVLPSGAVWKGTKISERKVAYTACAGGVKITKEYELFPDKYVVKMAINVALLKNDALGETKQPGESMRLAVSLFGHAPHSTEGRAKVPTGAICHLNGSVSTVSATDLKKGPRERGGTVRWVGLAHQYDLIAAAPSLAGEEYVGCNAYPLAGVADGIRVDLVLQEAKLEAGHSFDRSVVWYIGPKYLDRLEGADQIAGFAAGFSDVVDYGWFSFISRPLLWLLHRLYELVGNWGIAIILLTIIVKGATLYWTTKSMRSMKAMAALKPQIEEIQKRYPDDRAQQQQAQMALFKQHGVSPLAGCLPMLLQMPIWLALYKMLSVAGELHQAVFIPGWLVDLTARDPYFILPITLTGAMFLQSKVQPPAGDSMQQKMLMYGLPLMFGFMGLYFPSGLGVYMLTNTLLGIGHSLYMKRTDVHRQAGGGLSPRAADEKRPSGSNGRSTGKLAVLDAPESVEDGEDEVGEESKSSSPATHASDSRKGQRGKRRGKRR